MRKIDLDLLVDIATDAEEIESFDWGRLSVGKEEAYKMIGSSILDQFDKESYTEEDKIILLSTITQLAVENFLLNLKLLETQRNGRTNN